VIVVLPGLGSARTFALAPNSCALAVEAIEQSATTSPRLTAP
jgi:hypothetical protein